MKRLLLAGSFLAVLVAAQQAGGPQQKVGSVGSTLTPKKSTPSKATPRPSPVVTVHDIYRLYSHDILHCVSHTLLPDRVRATARTRDRILPCIGRTGYPAGTDAGTGGVGLRNRSGLQIRRQPRSEE